MTLSKASSRQERSRYGKSATKGQGTQEDACLGEVEVMEQGYGELDSKVEMSIGLMHVHECWTPRSVSLRESDTFGNRKRCHGTNHSRVSEFRSAFPVFAAATERSVEPYESLSHRGEVDELVLRRVLYGISCPMSRRRKHQFVGVARLRRSKRSEAA